MNYLNSCDSIFLITRNILYFYDSDLRILAVLPQIYVAHKSIVLDMRNDTDICGKTILA